MNLGMVRIPVTAEPLELMSLPYHPTSWRESKTEVILGMAVAIIVLSKPVSMILTPECKLGTLFLCFQTRCHRLSWVQIKASQRTGRHDRITTHQEQL
jgi:hypothetical protein